MQFSTKIAKNATFYNKNRILSGRVPSAKKRTRGACRRIN